MSKVKESNSTKAITITGLIILALVIFGRVALIYLVLIALILKIKV